MELAEYTFTKNGNVIASGTLDECAKQLGKRTNTLRYLLMDAKRKGNASIKVSERSGSEWTLNTQK